MKIIRSLWSRIKNSRRRTKVIGIIILIVILALQRRSSPIELEYAKVQRQNITISISASGILTGKNSATLRFNSAGILTYLPFKNGDIVQKGQIIAKLDTTALNASYSQALNNKRNTQAQLDAIYDSLRGKESTETFEEKAKRTAAEVANDNAYNSLLASRKSLMDANIYAPFTGIIVGQEITTTGQNVGPTNIIAQIVDFSEKQFEINIDQSDISKVKVGQNTLITIDAYPDREFAGKIISIGSQINKDATGSVTILIKSTIDEGDILDIYGLEGQASILGERHENTLTIPQNAMVDENHVYVKSTNGKNELREIKTGISDDINIEIISGLNEDEEIVTNPQAIQP